MAEGAACRCVAPSASARSWWPRQIPKIGTSPSSPATTARLGAERRGVARAVGEEDAVGLERADLVGRVVDAGTTVTRERAEASWRTDRRLDAVVEGHDVRAPGPERVGRRAVVTSRHEVAAVGAARGARRGARRRSGRPVPKAPGSAPRPAQVPGQAASVDARRSPATPWLDQEPLERPDGAPVRRPCALSSRTTTPAHHGRARLVVERRHAVVADVRVGEGDDLAGVARVGEDLLVAAERGVEDELAARDTAAARSPRPISPRSVAPSARTRVARRRSRERPVDDDGAAAQRRVRAPDPTSVAPVVGRVARPARERRRDRRASACAGSKTHEVGVLARGDRAAVRAVAGTRGSAARSRGDRAPGRGSAARRAAPGRVARRAPRG